MSMIYLIDTGVPVRYESLVVQRGSMYYCVLEAQLQPPAASYTTHEQTHQAIRSIPDTSPGHTEVLSSALYNSAIARASASDVHPSPAVAQRHLPRERLIIKRVDLVFNSGNAHGHGLLTTVNDWGRQRLTTSDTVLRRWCNNARCGLGGAYRRNVYRDNIHVMACGWYE